MTRSSGLVRDTRRTGRDANRSPSRDDFSKVTYYFDSGGSECVGWLYRPDRPADPPVVVMANGLGSERRFGLPAVAERLAERGYAVFLFDYRHFGDSEGEPRNLVDPARQLDDWRAAVANVRQASGVDARRLALWGTGLSGGHVISLAAEDARVDAVVAQTPLTSGRAVLRSRPVKQQVRAVGAALRDRLGSLVGRPYVVPLVGDPEELAVLNATGAKDAFRTLVPDDSEWENACPARSFLALSSYRPADDAERVSCPTLLVAGGRDEIAPSESVEQVAETMSNATLLRLPVGHFDFFHDDTFEQVLGHQVTFLDSVLDS
ncbi:MAG: alpha/beta hydrolase [Halobacteriota archaeon]